MDSRKKNKLLFLCLFLLGLLFALPASRRAGVSWSVYGNDFTVFYAASKNLLLKSDPYNHPIAAKTPYLYPPLFAFLLLPLALFPLPIAAFVWYFINFIAALYLCWLIASVFEKSYRMSVFLVLLIIIFRIVVDNLWWGQCNILIALFLMLWFLGSGKTWLSSFMLCLAISIKVTPTLLLFYILLKRQWGELGRVLVCLSVVNLATFILIDNRIALIKGWFQRTVLNAEGFNWAYAGNQSLRAAVTRLFSLSNTEATLYPYVNLFDLKDSMLIWLLVVFLLSLLFIWKIVKREDRKFHLHELAMVCSLMLLLSNLSWKAHFVMLAPALGILVGEWIKVKSKKALLLLLITFLFCSIGFQPIFGETLHQFSEVYSSYTLTAIIAFLSMVFHKPSVLMTTKIER
ncbi:MAG: DUF2029 domain-containing protein [Blastocatellia bacterium]|nr:DUF2029 domain-containing protein [Blastocatellia bacterium]